MSFSSLRTQYLPGLLVFMGTLLSTIPSQGQDYQQMMTMPGNTAYTVIQPAFLAPLSESVTLRASLDAGGRFYNTAIPYATLAQDDHFLDESEKSALLEGIEGDERLWGDFAIQAQGQKAFGQHVVSVGYASRNKLRAFLPDGDLPGLLLRGNAAYQDQTVQGSGLQFSNARWQELQLGYATRLFGQTGDSYLDAGIMLRPMLGGSWQSFTLENGSLYTGPNGDSIAINAQYQEFRGESGRGLGLNAGLNWEFVPGWQIEAATGNWGLMQWEGQGREVQASFASAGLDGGPLFREVFPVDANFFQLDTLNAQFLPDRQTQTQRQQFLPYAHLAIHANRYRFNDSDRMIWRSVTAVQWQQGLDGRWLPSAVLGVSAGLPLSQEPFADERLSAGLNISSGPWQRLGIGASLRGVLSFGEHYLNLYLAADQLQGLIGEGQSFSLRGGMMLVIW